MLMAQPNPTTDDAQTTDARGDVEIALAPYRWRLIASAAHRVRRNARDNAERTTVGLPARIEDIRTLLAGKQIDWTLDAHGKYVPRTLSFTEGDIDDILAALDVLAERYDANGHDVLAADARELHRDITGQADRTD